MTTILYLNFNRDESVFFYFWKPFHNNIFLCVKRPILKRSIFSRLLLIFRCNLYITVDFFLLDLECPKLQRNVFHFNWIFVFYLCFMFFLILFFPPDFLWLHHHTQLLDGQFNQLLREFLFLPLLWLFLNSSLTIVVCCGEHFCFVYDWYRDLRSFKILLTMFHHAWRIKSNKSY